MQARRPVLHREQSGWVKPQPAHASNYLCTCSRQARRKLELEATVARLRAEIQELDQSLELVEQETEAQGDLWGWEDEQWSGCRGTADGHVFLL